MMQNKKSKKEVLIDIFNDYKTGMTVEDLSEKYHCSELYIIRTINYVSKMRTLARENGKDVWG